MLDCDLANAYFLLRRKQPYAGHFNGFGGKIELGESVHEAMSRELEEETDLKRDDLQKLIHLMTIKYPSEIELNVFYAILNKEVEPNYRIDEEGTIRKCQITDKMLAANNSCYAGDGNIAYFLNYALRLEGRDISTTMSDGMAGKEL